MKKRVYITLVIDEDKLESVQKIHGGTVAEAMTKFVDTQLCRQAEVEKLEVKRHVKRRKP